MRGREEDDDGDGEWMLAKGGYLADDDDRLAVGTSQS